MMSVCEFVVYRFEEQCLYLGASMFGNCLYPIVPGLMDCQAPFAFTAKYIIDL